MGTMGTIESGENPCSQQLNAKKTFQNINLALFNKKNKETFIFGYWDSKVDINENLAAFLLC